MIDFIGLLIIIFFAFALVFGLNKAAKISEKSKEIEKVDSQLDIDKYFRNEIQP